MKIYVVHDPDESPVEYEVESVTVYALYVGATMTVTGDGDLVITDGPDQPA